MQAILIQQQTKIKKTSTEKYEMKFKSLFFCDVISFNKKLKGPKRICICKRHLKERGPFLSLTIFSLSHKYPPV